MDSSGFIAAMVQPAQEMFSAFLKRTDGGFLVKIRVVRSWWDPYDKVSCFFTTQTQDYLDYIHLYTRE
jgi:hypothetical protein